jgi:hypothetical protein
MVLPMVCSASCKHPTPTQAHCGTCHRTFGSVRGFDKHRRRGECVDPATLGFEQRDRVWRQPITEDELARKTRSRVGGEP